MQWQTFNEWSQFGYKIIKGSKATWVDGIPMFSKKQVTKKEPSTFRGYWSGADDGYDYDDPWEDVARQAAWGND
jgi:hypothetical protein